LRDCFLSRTFSQKRVPLPVSTFFAPCFVAAIFFTTHGWLILFFFFSCVQCAVPGKDRRCSQVVAIFQEPPQKFCLPPLPRGSFQTVWRSCRVFPIPVPPRSPNTGSRRSTHPKRKRQKVLVVFSSRIDPRPQCPAELIPFPPFYIYRGFFMQLHRAADGLDFP